jgi:hypothetical protein
MQRKHRNWRTATSVEDEIAHLRGLDLGGLRARWQGVFQRPAPAHLTRHLLFAVIAYRIQADRFGDLDHPTRQELDRTVAKEAGPAISARLASFDQKRTACRARPFVPALSRPDPELVIVTLHEVSEVFDTAATARLALYLLGFWGDASISRCGSGLSPNGIRKPPAKVARLRSRRDELSAVSVANLLLVVRRTDKRRLSLHFFIATGRCGRWQSSLTALQPSDDLIVNTAHLGRQGACRRASLHRSRQ